MKQTLKTLFLTLSNSKKTLKSLCHRSFDPREDEETMPKAKVTITVEPRILEWIERNSDVPIPQPFSCFRVCRSKTHGTRKEGFSMTPIAWYTGSIPKIEEARDKQEWFNAIVLSAIQLERYGYFKIKKHLESVKVNYRKRDLENLSLPEIALFLLALEQIEANDYNKMLDVNRVRNKFVHRRETYKFSVGTKAKDEHEPLVNEAIRILKEKLGATRVVFSRG